ncbi:BamA/TamA family outer membrane protein [Bacteroidota bacterium]
MPENQIILKKAKIKNAPEDCGSDLNSLIKQNPRQRLYGLTDPFLWIYLKFDSKKDNFINRKIKQGFGEKPIMLDSNLLIQSQMQMQDYLLNKGYFRNDVKYSIKYHKKHKAKVSFQITSGAPYFIKEVDFYIADRTIYSILSPSFAQSLILSGEKYDSDKLINERIRIASILNEKGYYKFSKYYVYFEVDTTYGDKQEVNVDVVIRNLTDTSLHKQYLINNVTIEPDYNILDTIIKDTNFLLGYRFIGSNVNINPSIFLRNLKFRQGNLYSIQNVKQTINLLNELDVYKFIDIDFSEKVISGSDTALLDCYIRLTPQKRQEWVIDLEANTTEEKKFYSDNPNRYYGMAGGITFRNKNIFKRAVQWSVGFGGSFDVLKRESKSDQLIGNYQMDAKTALYFPYAFLPGRFLNNTSFKSTKTAISLSYFYEQNLDFTRKTANLSYTYQFNKDFVKHFVTPFEISQVNTDVTNEKLLAIIQSDKLLRSLFETHLLTTARWSLSFKNQGIKDKRYWRIRWNVFESTGNIPRAIYVLNEGNRSKSDTTIYELLGINFFQYFKTDVDASYNYLINPWSSFASRIFLGMGFPYGNSTILPFEKRYFIGGANSIRAWPLRGLGPGGAGSVGLGSFDRSGEIKIENNYEYRFDIVSLLKGAVFLDMGNIWALRDDPELLNEDFKFSRFISEVAIGTGFGFRFDFVYFILRLDMGIPVRDPSLAIDKRWVIQHTTMKDIVWNIGIGYPF